MNVDAFSRVRVSEPITLFEYAPIFDKASTEWEEVVHGTSASSTITTNSYIAMRVAAADDVVIRQTYEYIDYQPGKSKLSLFTGVLNVTPSLGVVARLGQYDDFNDKTVVVDGGNGHFFEMDGLTLNVVQRSGGQGTTLGNFDTRVAQVNWNIDRLDGEGPSKLRWDATDFAYLRLFVIDVQWLGIGRVRMGIYLNGTIYYLHEYLNNWGTQPYNRMEKLPLRYEIRSTGGAGELRQVCSSVIIEGGTYLPLARMSGYNTTAAVKVRRLALRLKPAYNRVTLVLHTLSFLPGGGSSTEFDWYVHRVPATSITTGTWLATPEIVDVNLSTTDALSADAILLTSGFGVAHTDTSFPLEKRFMRPLVSSMNGTSFVLVVTCSVNCAIALSWIEIR